MWGWLCAVTRPAAQVKPCTSGTFIKKACHFPCVGSVPGENTSAFPCLEALPALVHPHLRGRTAPSRPAFLPPMLLTLTLSTDVPRTGQPAPQPSPKDGCQHQEGQTEAEPPSGSANLAAPASGFARGEMTTTERGREGV